MIEDREEPCRPSCPAGDCANCVRFDLRVAAAAPAANPATKPRTPRYNAWTPAEDTIVMEHYRSKGWVHCADLLATERTEAAIRARAIDLERLARGGAPAKRGKEQRSKRKLGEAGPRHQAFMAAAGRKFLDINRAPRVSSIFALAQGITV